jgi:3-oxoacyl-[acyl-carrier protein] reductase
MLQGRVVLVTGGSGAIGGAVARVAAAHGADVAFTWRGHEEKARALAGALEAEGRRVLSGRVEAEDPRAVEDFAARVESEWGRIDALVNNVGTAQVMPFALLDAADWDQAMAVNLRSMFLFAKAVARGMIRRRAGAIVNVGSVAGHRLLEVPVHYAAAKAGVSGLTVALAKDLSRYRIRVNEVCPGLIEGGVGANTSERQRAQHAEYCALGRAGRPEEVAEVVAFLASERSSYVNAQRWVVDGGL